MSGPSTGKPCRARNVRGEPCSAPANASGYCFWHDPARAADRTAARARGGRARHGRTIGEIGGPRERERVSLRTIDDVLALLERTASDLLLLENSINRARALASVAGEAGRLVAAYGFEERLRALERERRSA